MKKPTKNIVELASAYETVTNETTASIINSREENLKNAMLKEIKSRNPEFNLNESIKKSTEIYNNFSEKLATYPKHISYEAAILLNIASIAGYELSIVKLPLSDQEVVNSQIDKLIEIEKRKEKSKFLKSINRTRFTVQLDNSKNFELVFVGYGCPSDEVEVESQIRVRLFNTVLYPPESHANPVLVINSQETSNPENPLSFLKNENIQDKLKRLAGIVPTQSEKISPQEHQVPSFPSEQNVIKTSKNAFEIRSDVLSMAIKWASIEEPSVTYKKPTDDELLNLARKFYKFVENKNN